MTNFVSSNDDSAEATGVLDDGNTVDLLQSLIHNASSADIRESFNFESRIRRPSGSYEIITSPAPGVSVATLDRAISNFTIDWASHRHRMSNETTDPDAEIGN